MFRNISDTVKKLFWINVGVFILTVLLQGIFRIPVAEYLALYPVHDENFHYYQFITSMFMHGGLMHLLFNMLALVSFGSACEDHLGSKKFLLYYFIMGIFGSCVQLLFTTGPMIGASAAIFGLLIYFTLLHPNDKVSIFPFPISFKIKYLTMVFVSIEILSLFSASDGVGHFAHLGGGLAGLILYIHDKLKNL